MSATFIEGFRWGVRVGMVQGSDSLGAVIRAGAEPELKNASFRAGARAAIDAVDGWEIYHHHGKPAGISREVCAMLDLHAQRSIREGVDYEKHNA